MNGFVSAYWIDPTTDIHLVADGPAMKLRLFHIRTVASRKWQEVTSEAGHTFTPANPDIVTVTPVGRFLPGSLGTTTVRIERSATPGMSALRAIVRVSVHSRIERIWAGNNQVTVHTGASNYILSVYAEFTDGTIADITGHPYLRYSANPSFVLIDPDGRVHGRNVTLGTPVFIEVQGLPDSVAPTQVEITVIDPAEELIPSLVPIHGSAQLTDRRNILLVAEGFSGSEMATFRANVVNELAKRLFGSRSHSPFHLLRDSFNLWVAMQPSAERGITVGPAIKIIRSAAEPFVPAAGAAHLPGDLFPLQVRDSYFGLMYGARLGDPEARTWSNGVADDQAKWIQPPRAARSIAVDYRRLPDLQTDPVVSFRARLDEFFDRLGPDAAQWKTNQRDAGLVCFLINDDIHGGSGLFDQTTVAATLGHGDFLLDSLDNPPLHPERSFWDHEPRLTSQNPNIEALAAKVSHELGHSPVFRLGDEYEDSLPTPDHERPKIEAYRNLHTSLIVGTGGDPPAIDPARVKWNRHRIARAGLLRATPRVQPQDRIFVPLRRGTTNVWTLRDEVFLRNPESNALSPPLEFAGYDPATEEAFLITTGGRSPADYNLGAYALGSVLYIPLRDSAGAIRTLIDPTVLADLGAHGAFGQLTMAQCTGVAPAPGDNPAGDPSGMRSPRIRPPNTSFWLPDYKIIGLYEGGGIFRCRVYRPSGYCRMRHHYDYKAGDHVDFCFVCKYFIIDSIDPQQHPTLDAEYPE